ncbi:MAG: TonB family protein [Gammaproteobacteria bacterium]|nr:TonB family protein [Gammaproteobacteria bacterium]
MIVIMLFAAKSLAVLSAALLLTRSQRFSASMRHLILIVAIASLPVMLILSVFSPSVISVQPPALVNNWVLEFELPEIAVVQGETTAETPSILSPGFAAAILYGLISATLMAYWIAQIVSTSTWIRNTRVLKPFTSEGITRPLTLRQTDSHGSPLTWGLLRPDVVVPYDWSSWPRDKQRAVLVHELSHIRRYDTFTSLFSVFVSSLFWINPLVWIAHRRLLMEAEHACDDSVVNQGISPTSYANQLLEITRAQRLGVAVAMVSSSTLSRRVHALIDTGTRRKSMTLRQAFTILILGFAIVLPLGSCSSHPVASSTENLIVNPGDADQAPPMSTAVFDRLAEVQELLDAKDYQSALDALATTLRSSDLNGNEIGQIHNMRAFVYFTMDGYAQAIGEYEKVIAQGEAIPVGLKVTTLYTLAQLSFVTEQYQNSLDYMASWRDNADNPGPQSLIFMGQVHYQMHDFPAAMERIEEGVRIAQERGTPVKENWWGLLVYLHYELENWDRTIEILEILRQEFPNEKYDRRLQGLRSKLAGDSSVEVHRARVHVVTKIRSDGGGFPDGNYLPIVKVAPVYPRDAQTQGIEGYVVLEFVVTRTGRTADVVVVESSPPDVFDSAALNAVQRYKYKPRVVDGKPIEVAGVRNRISFELLKE